MKFIKTIVLQKTAEEKKALETVAKMLSTMQIQDLENEFKEFILSLEKNLGCEFIDYLTENPAEFIDDMRIIIEIMCNSMAEE